MPRRKIFEAVLDNSGRPISGGSCYVYDRATTDQTTVFTDETGSVSIDQPLSVTSGRIEGWLDEGAYDLVVSAPGFDSYTQAFDAVPADDVHFTKQIPHTFTVGGTVSATTADDALAMFVPVPPNQTAALVGAKHILGSGTSVAATVQINGTSQEAYTNLSVTSTAGSAGPGSISLANGDKVSLVLTSPSGSPKGLSFTIFIGYV